MDQKVIDKLINNLDWSLPKNTQEKSINSLISINDEKLHMLVQPIAKSHWENASIVIKHIGYPRIKNIIPTLLIWLQDVNWPGALTILDVLAQIDKKNIIKQLEQTLITAKNDEDYMWIGGLKRLIEKTDINANDFSSKEIFNIIELADW